MEISDRIPSQSCWVVSLSPVYRRNNHICLQEGEVRGHLLLTERSRNLDIPEETQI